MCPGHKVHSIKNTTAGDASCGKAYIKLISYGPWDRQRRDLRHRGQAARRQFRLRIHRQLYRLRQRYPRQSFDRAAQRRPAVKPLFGTDRITLTLRGKRTATSSIRRQRAAIARRRFQGRSYRRRRRRGYVRGDAARTASFSQCDVRSSELLAECYVRRIFARKRLFSELRNLLRKSIVAVQPRVLFLGEVTVHHALGGLRFRVRLRRENRIVAIQPALVPSSISRQACSLFAIDFGWPDSSGAGAAFALCGFTCTNG